jgi:hypothetical protein
MQNNNNNNKWFALIVAMFLMVITSLLALYLLEYIIPFARNTKWMENWTKAYYEANKWIEDVLYSMKKKDAYFETWITAPSTSTWYYYTLSSTGETIPIEWDWTSEFGSGYNKISISNPVQLLIKWTITNATWNNVKFYFKVPHFDDTTSTAIVFTWWSATTTPIINWQLSWSGETLNSSWSQIMYSHICKSDWCTSWIDFSSKDWYTLSWTIEDFATFYNDSNNNCSISWCILKLSVVNELLTNDSRKIPYLEYKIVFPAWTNVANYYSIIRTSWKSTWYRKDLKLYIPQQTTIEAFDFTVFQ